MRRAGPLPNWLNLARPDTRPAGYAWLIERGGLLLQRRQHLSYLTEKSLRETIDRDGYVVDLYPQRSYDPGDGLPEQLEFALKYDGVDLGVLRAAFRQFEDEDVQALTAWISAKPSSQYSRRAWFLYEWLTGQRLPLPDAKSGNYVPLFDERYYAASPRKSRRHRVDDNALGDATFCPIARRTKALEDWNAQRLGEEAASVIREYDEATLRRAVNYLYTRETKSTYRIEGEVADGDRAARFVDVLRRIHEVKELSEAELVRLQNVIVSSPYQDQGFRTENVYVGEKVDLTRQRIHFIAPRHEDVPALMAGWMESVRRIRESDAPPVVQAALASFAFVFIHPFQDGNGRLHRLVIHHVLARSGFSPPGIVLPVSAVMLERRAEYDEALESVSEPMLPLIQFDEDEEWRISISNETADLYRYLDYSRIAEDLFRWTAETIRKELRHELEFVQNYDRARAGMEAVVDLPDRLLNNFIHIVLNNGGTLSKAKRKMFDRLTDDQISRLEKAVADAFQIKPK